MFLFPGKLNNIS
jgi:hypothetical protein